MTDFRNKLSALAFDIHLSFFFSSTVNGQSSKEFYDEDF